MIRLIFLFIGAVLLASVPAAPVAAQGKCDFCETNPPPKGDGGGRPDNKGGGKNPPINLAVESDINFGRLVMLGDGIGRVMVDLQTGAKTVVGNLDDLGGIAVQGRAIIYGQAGQAIRVSFPTSVTLSDPAGGQAELRDFVSDLGPLPRLDVNGILEFRFTGTLHTDISVAIGGNLRGRVPLQVAYD